MELVQDCMAVLITCKSDEDSIKNEIAIVQETFFEVHGVLKGGNSYVNSWNWAKLNFYTCPNYLQVW